MPDSSTLFAESPDSKLRPADAQAEPQPEAHPHDLAAVQATPASIAPAVPTTPVTSHFRWLRTGEEAFVPMLAAIEAAQSSVRLEMYIYTASPIGEKFREALVKARNRGVKVRVLIDSLGSFSLPASFWDPLRAVGGDCRWFNPLQLLRMTYRDHRKILVCDEHLAFVGGYNIAPEYQGDGITHGWRDLGIQVTGPLAVELARSFDAAFTRADFKHKRFARLRRAPVKHRVSTPDGDLFLTGPGRGPSPLKRALIEDLTRARQIRIISAYFLPTWRIRHELMARAARGFSVKLIVAGKTDVALSQLACRRLYSTLLRTGIEIYEYQPQILHAKLLIFDDVVYVGSSNLDTRSLNINYELLLRINNPDEAARAQQIFDDDLTRCTKIDLGRWRQSRSLWQKLKERWAYFVLAKVDPYWARRQLYLLG